jgi:AraC family transcriptional activator of pobA
MKTPIPLYELAAFSTQDGNRDVFFLSERSDQPGINISVPYRSDYYKIGICLQGTAKLKVNLESYDIGPNSLIVIPPGTIKQWPEIAPDFQSLSLFFTREFIASNTIINPDKFPFFESGAQHAIELSPAASENITAALLILQEKHDAPHPYRNELLQSHIASLLYEMAAIYDAQTVVSHAVLTRGQQLSAEFKQLVLSAASTERGLKFYAERLFITPKYLTETVKETTGKTAGEWITESAVLESKVLLRNPALTIAEIAGLLQFSDQAAFSKFFKRNTGLSPAAYKEAV